MLLAIVGNYLKQVATSAITLPEGSRGVSALEVGCCKMVGFPLSSWRW